MSFSDEVLAEFRAEGREHVEVLEAALLFIDQEPGHEPSVHQAFRAIHSLKGAAGFLQRPDIERITHHGEELLDLARKDPSILDADAVSTLLRAGDACSRLLEEAHTCEAFWVDDLVAELVAHGQRLVGALAPTGGLFPELTDEVETHGFPEPVALEPPTDLGMPAPVDLEMPAPVDGRDLTRTKRMSSLH